LESITKNALHFKIALGAAALVLGTAGLAGASVTQPSVVSENPVDYTPILVATTTIPSPRVDSIAQLGKTMYVGGLFSTVKDASGTSFARHNLMAFDASTGAIRGSFAPNVDANIWAVEAAAGAVYVGGEFKTIDGVSRVGLAKLDPTTGTVDPTFNARFRVGRVNEIQLLGTGPTAKLIVGGGMPGKLIALDPTTGRNTGYLQLPISDPIPNAWGGVSVYNFAIDNAQQRLAVTGNFSTVSGQPRSRLFVATLGANQATLSPWYYPGFTKPCSSTSSRRIAYLQGVDFSPDGQFLDVAATGQVPVSRADIWPTGAATYPTVCDGAGRFNMNNDQAPVWVNYTGGDSVWSVVDTGVAVYVQGHFQWLDNPLGGASECRPLGAVCARRRGIGAIQPVTGKALPWNPDKPARQGGKDMLATAAGLWVGSDSERFHGEYRRGIALAPLP
jgi:hypothetical protein